jgi:hypothetical protein
MVFLVIIEIALSLLPSSFAPLHHFVRDEREDEAQDVALSVIRTKKLQGSSTGSVHSEKFHSRVRPRSPMCHMDQGSIKLSAGPTRGRKSLITGVVPKQEVPSTPFYVTYVRVRSLPRTPSSGGEKN